MDEDTKSFAIAFLAILAGIALCIAAVVFVFEAAKDHDAKRCAEYGYECPKED